MYTQSPLNPWDCKTKFHHAIRLSNLSLHIINRLVVFDVCVSNEHHQVLLSYKQLLII